uniref:Uncharacterized protein n=1 Tax=Cacopsylla melanoneura TaxID=428564 RepID=A0A8D8R2M2_9HEMI
MIIRTRPCPESSGICSRSEPSRRWASSSWTSTLIWCPCTMLNLWRRSQTPTWTSTSGMRRTSDDCSRPGLNPVTRNHPHSWSTNGAKASTICRKCGTSPRGNATSYSSPGSRKCTRRLI